MKSLDKKIFKQADFFFMNQGVSNVIETNAKKEKHIIYGARAMNAQLPLFMRRETQDYDVYSSKPKQTADMVQRRLDKEVAGGKDDFYMKPALHKGTYKVMHEGADGKKRTRDDIGIVDYTIMPNQISTVRIEGIRYESIPSIAKRKKEILQDPESEYRHDKDRSDLERIKYSRILKGRVF